MVYLARENTLDKLVCKIRDCFISGKKAFTKFANGTTANLCFARRHSVQRTKAAFDVRALLGLLKADMPYMAKPERFGPGSEEAALAKTYVAQRKANHKSAHYLTPVAVIEWLIQAGTLPNEPMFTEELLNFETDGTEQGLARSVDAWTKVFEAWHLPKAQYDREVIATVLRRDWGTRPPALPHRDVIFNHAEVKALLFSSPEFLPFRWMWRE